VTQADVNRIIGDILKYAIIIGYPTINIAIWAVGIILWREDSWNEAKEFVGCAATMTIAALVLAFVLWYASLPSGAAQ